MSFADELRQEGNKKKQYGYADGCFQHDWIRYLKKCAQGGKRQLQGYLGVNIYGSAPINKYAPYYTPDSGINIVVCEIPLKFERRVSGDENGSITLEEALNKKERQEGSKFSSRIEGEIFSLNCVMRVDIPFSMTDEVDMVKEIQAEIMKCSDGSFNRYSTEIVKVKRPYNLERYGKVIQAHKKNYFSETPEIIECGWRECTGEPQMYAIYVDIAW